VTLCTDVTWLDVAAIYIGLIFCRNDKGIVVTVRTAGGGSGIDVGNIMTRHFV
jgi:hypothetical protein